MAKKRLCRLLSVLTAITMLITMVSAGLLYTAADETTAPENVLQTQLASVRPIIMYPTTGTVVDSNRFNAANANAVAMTTDGDKDTAAEVWGALDWNPARYVGVEYTLKSAVDCGAAYVYAQSGEKWRVYASESVDTLYTADSLVDTVTAAESGAKVTLDRRVRYVAFVNEAYEGAIHVRELEVFTAAADETTAPENVLQTQLASVRPIIMYPTTGTVVDSSRFNAANANAVTMTTDGDKDTAAEVWGALDWDPARYVGVEYTLKSAVDCGAAYVYAQGGEKWRVYASESADTLYTADSLVDTVTAAESGAKVTLDRKVRYVAFVNEFYEGAIHIRELEVFTAEPDSGFVSENALRTKLATAAGVNMFVSNGQIESSSRFDVKGALAASTDGDRTTATDVYGALDWNPARYVGAVYSLTDTVFADYIMIYSGFDAYKDTYRVYASESLDTLYSPDSIVGNNIACGDAGVKLEVGKRVRYVAFFCTDYVGNQRVKEFELWTGEDTDASKNLLKDSVSSAVGIFYNENGTVETTTRVTEASIQALTDGVTDAWTDLPGSIDWSPAKYPGVQYTLDASYYIDKLTVYAGINASYPEQWRVYASDAEETLYDEAHRLGTLDCTGTEQTLTVGKEVRYVAFVCVAQTGNPRPREFEVWSGTKPDDGGKDTVVKVLTVGNSFAENASIYATEIAAAGGKSLTFGYLKYPSCTIDQHYDNAVNDKAVYKFALTENRSGTVVRTTVKDGSSSFATIREALEYTDWDIVVLQQGSTASYDYAAYAKTPQLMEYIRGYLPEVRFLIHETWSWATWSLDGNPANDFKNIEKAYHQMAADNGNLTIIPSGRAFEFARRDGIGVNDADNQHANAYGQYLAGACYVATIFGGDITANPFGDGHPAFADVDMTVLRSAVRNAMSYIYDPNSSWDWSDGKDIPEDTLKDPDSVNFIARHYADHSTIAMNPAAKMVSEHTHFVAANAKAVHMAIDGQTDKDFEVWGALDWDPPQYVGVMFTLDGSYNVDTAVVYGKADVTVEVYASDSITTLHDAASYVGKVSCSGGKTEIAIGRQISYVSFLISGYTAGSSAHLMELDLTGSDTAVVKEPIVWPAMPAGENLLKNAAATKIIAPNGDFAGTKEYTYGLMDSRSPVELSVLTDGDLQKHFDVWSLTNTDKPGVLYDLGAYYDISHLHVWAGADGSQFLVVNGYRIYASDSLQELYKTKNLVASYSNADDSTNEYGLNTQLKRVRYIAFLLTDSSDGGWRMREFAAVGTRSADQSQPVERKSIIEGMDAEYYGVAGDNLADPVYMGASNFVSALTDGSRDNVEFWGGSDIQNTRFVFIYNLYENFDLTGADIYAFADSIEEDSGIHKGIRSAKIYASRKFDTLFTGTPVTVKEDYEDSARPDETSSFSAEAPASWKQARYVAFVFTIGDSRYGACRLEELKVYGTLSAEQDKEEEKAKLPQYIDLTADNGVVARIFAKDANDDLTKLAAVLQAAVSTETADLSFVEQALTGFKASQLYKLSIVNEGGAAVDTGGRLIRLSLPVEDTHKTVACVDENGAEIVSSGVLGDCITVETETLRSYALVTAVDTGTTGAGGVSPLLIVTICLGVLACAGLVATVCMALAVRKKK